MLADTGCRTHLEVSLAAARPGEGRPSVHARALASPPYGTYGPGMDATAVTIVSQVITDARSRFGASAVAVVEIDGDLLDQTMAHVLEVGGEVGLDSCVVDGVTVRERPADAEHPVVHLHDDPEPRPLVPLEGDDGS